VVKMVVRNTRQAAGFSSRHGLNRFFRAAETTAPGHAPPAASTPKLSVGNVSSFSLGRYLGSGDPITHSTILAYLHDVIEHTAAAFNGFGRCNIFLVTGHQRILGAARGKHV